MVWPARRCKHPAVGYSEQVAAQRYLLAGLVVGLVAGLVWIGVTPLGAPGPAPVQGAPTRFSAGRALVLLREIAAVPRPMGSVAAARVRALLVRQLGALGLSPQEQTAGVVSAENGRVAGTVRNVFARLPGTRSSRTVLLVAHYDSVPVAPGAADDGGGVVTLLETARALAAASAGGGHGAHHRGPRAPRRDQPHIRAARAARASLAGHPSIACLPESAAGCDSRAAR